MSENLTEKVNKTLKDAHVSLSKRTTQAIQNARISPRILSKVTKIHYTTIYSIIRDEAAERTANPLTIDTLNKTLDDIDKLLEQKKLPFEPTTSHAFRGDELEKLLNTI